MKAGCEEVLFYATLPDNAESFSVIRALHCSREFAKFA